jgi:hypothetical protein
MVGAGWFAGGLTVRCRWGGTGRLARWGALALLTLGAVSGALMGSGPASAASGPTFTFGPAPSPNTQALRSSFRYSLRPGETISDTVLLTNLTNQPEEFLIWAADGYNTPRSGYLVLRPETYPKKDVAKWITLPVTAGVHELPAQTTATLTFVLQVPPDATPGDHVGGIEALNVTPLPSTNGKTQFSIHEGIATAVFVHVIGPLHPSAAVVAINVAQSEPALGFAPGTSHAFIAYKLENIGNTLLSGRVYVHVTDVFGRTVKTFPSTPVANFIPGQVFTVVEPKWQPLPFIGPQNVHVVFKPVGAATATGAATIWVIPWLLLLLIVLAVAAATWWLRRRRKRSAASPDTPPAPAAPEQEPVSAAT